MASNLLSATVAAGDTVTATERNLLRKDILINAGDYVVTTGSANAYVYSGDAQITAYTAGLVIKIKANFTNTGAATINVNAIGAKSIKKNVTEALAPGDIKQDQVLSLIYDGTNFQLLHTIAPSRYGDGSDGDVTISSNTTLNPTYKVFQYNNFTVNSGIILDFGSNFQNKPVIVFVKNNLTLNGATVSVTGLGGPGGASQPSVKGDGNDGSAGSCSFGDQGGNFGQGGGQSINTNAGVGGAAAGSTIVGEQFFKTPFENLAKLVFIGAGGASGGAGGWSTSVSGIVSGAGGNGGGGIIFIVGGNIDVTNAVLTANGAAGSAPPNAPSNVQHGRPGAGGGGQGGSFRIFYAGTKTGSPATHTATGGAGATGGAASGSATYGGGGGGSGGGSTAAGTAGTVAASGGAGGNGSAGTASNLTEIVKILVP